MFHRLVAGIALVVFAAPGIWAQAQDWSEPGYTPIFRACIATAGSDGERVVACENAETPRQVVALNTAYQKLSAGLKPYRKDLLVNDERAWIAFRDAECAFQGARLIGGPLGIEAQAQAEAKAECMLQQTHLRVRSLEDDNRDVGEAGSG